jgi:hypothetical protein
LHTIFSAIFHCFLNKFHIRFYRNKVFILIFKLKYDFYLSEYGMDTNPLPALAYQNVLDLNVACRAKHTQTYWHVRKFKCPLKKMQPSCPCSRDLNLTGKGLTYIQYTHDSQYLNICQKCLGFWTQQNIKGLGLKVLKLHCFNYQYARNTFNIITIVIYTSVHSLLM